MVVRDREEVAHTSIGKRAVGFQLKYFLVYFYFCNKIQERQKTIMFCVNR